MHEINLINYIRKQAGKSKKGIIEGIGDDCAVLKYDKNNYLLWASDMLTEGTHFKLKDGYKRIGKKGVKVNISDIAAMGGIPKYITVSVGIPKRIKERDIRKIYEGIFEVSKKYGIKVLGGDTNSSSSLVIDISILGFVRKKHLIRRSGAQKGDLILVTGPVRDGKKNHLDFEPRLKEALFLAGKYKINSMIDVSDGLAPDLWRLLSESRTGCRLYTGSVPLSKGLSLEDALYFGESFEILFTLTKKEARKLFKDKELKKKNLLFFIIGEIVDNERGKKIILDEGKIEKLTPKGFEHI